MERRNAMKQEYYYKKYLLLNRTPRQFLERRLTNIFGINSKAIEALELVCLEMSAEKGFTRDDGQDYYNHCIDVANTLISFDIRNFTHSFVLKSIKKSL